MRRSGYIALCLILLTVFQVGKSQLNNPAPYPGVNYVNVPCSQPNNSNHPSNSINDFIDNFYTVGAVINFSNMNSGCNALPNNYIYYKCKYQMQVTAGQTVTCHVQSGIGFAQGFALWIDWDQDNAFAPTEKMGFTVGYPPAATWTTFSVVIPPLAPNGIYRMRVRSSYVTSGADPLFTATSAQNYGETEDYEIFVGITPPAAITATASAVTTTVCAGQTVSLNVAHNGATSPTYTWAGPAAFSSTLQNPVITNAQPMASGAYSVTVSNGVCTATSVVSIFVSPLPNATLTSNSPLCTGDTLNLIAATQGGGIYTYTWTGPAAFSSSVQSPQISSVSPSASGTYSLVLSNGFCATTNTIGVSVLPFPVVTLTASPPVCLGQTLTVLANAIGGSSLTYLWTGPFGYTSTAQNLFIANANPILAGTYSVTVFNGPCALTQTTDVLVYDYPVIWPTSNSPVCIGQTLSFTTNAVSSIPVTYTWSGPANFTSNQPDPVIANVTTLALGTFTIYVSNGVCTSTGNVVSDILANPSFSAASSSPVCTGLSLSLSATPLYSSLYSYTWTGPGSFSAPVQNGVIPNVTNAVAGVYSVVASDGTCSATHTVDAVVVDYPVFTVSPSATLCAGQNLTLSAIPSGTTAYAYNWNGPLGFNSPTQTTTLLNVSVGAAGVYSATANYSGCATTRTLDATVINFPALTLSATPQLCAGQNLSLIALISGTSAFNFNWAGPAGFSSTQQNPVIAGATQGHSGVYSLTVTDGFCPVSSTVSTNVFDYPAVTMFASDSICPGDTLYISASTQSSINPIFVWSGPNGFSAAQASYTNSNAQPAHTGIYSVTVSNSLCVTNATVQALVLDLPSFSVAVNSPICAGQNLSFTVVPVDTALLNYEWFGPLGFSSVNQNPQINNAVANHTGIYTVTATEACSSTRTIQARVFDYPIISLSVPPSLCAGATLTINTTATTTFVNSYSWSGPGGFSGNVKSPVIPNTTSTMSGVYTVSATHSICAVTSTVDVLIVDYPAFSLKAPGTLCAGETLTLSTDYNSTLSTSYSWSGPAEFSSNLASPVLINVTPKASGVYSVTVETMGCASKAMTTQVVVYPLPTATITPFSPTICTNSRVTLKVKGNATGFLWTPSMGLNHTAGDSVSASPSQTQQYMVIASANNCTSSAAVTVSVLPLPQPSIAVSKKMICQEDTVTLKGSGGTQYHWTGPSQKTYNGEVIHVKVAQQTKGDYTLTVTDANGCSDKAITTLSIQPLPQGNLIGYKENGCAPMCTTFSFAPAKGSQGAATVSKWHVRDNVLSGNPFSFCFGEPGIHFLNGQIIDTITKCVNHVEYQVNVYSRPKADFRYLPVKPLENLDEVVFTNTTEGNDLVKFNWYVFNDQRKFQSSSKDYKHLFTDGGLYTIAMVATDVNQCVDTVIKTIKVGFEYSLYVPNVFTPNGDNLNDIFLPLSRNVHDYTLAVYDRWGQQVFYSISTETGWDGMFHGMECKSDVYTWKIVLKTSEGELKEVVGHVWLTR